MRFGLHSGPGKLRYFDNSSCEFMLTASNFLLVFRSFCSIVTAGVLRGEKSRFQLFGDTVNTAARMESLGEVGT
jgi:hypothetical protein